MDILRSHVNINGVLKIKIIWKKTKSKCLADVSTVPTPARSFKRLSNS